MHCSRLTEDAVLTSFAMRRGSSISLWARSGSPAAAVATRLDLRRTFRLFLPEERLLCDHRSASRGDCSASLTITAAGCSRRPAGAARLGVALPEGELIATANLLPQLSRTLSFRCIGAACADRSPHRTASPAGVAAPLSQSPSRPAPLRLGEAAPELHAQGASRPDRASSSTDGSRASAQEGKHSCHR